MRELVNACLTADFNILFDFLRLIMFWDIGYDTGKLLQSE